LLVLLIAGGGFVLKLGGEETPIVFFEILFPTKLRNASQPQDATVGSLLPRYPPENRKLREVA